MQVQTPPQTRAFSIDLSLVNREARTLPVTFATETPCPSWYPDIGECMEILDCTPDACDMTRMANGMPFLSEHDRSRQIGRCVGAEFKDRKGIATVKFSQRQAAQDEFQDILDGIRTSVSVSYRPKSLTVESVDESGKPTVRINRWEVLENSLVSVPADPNARVGRSADSPSQPVTVTDPKNLLLTRQRSMLTPAIIDPPATPDITVVRAEILKEEQTRANEIRAAVEHLKKDGKDVAEAGETAIREGKSIAEFHRWVMENAYKAKSINLQRKDPRIGMSNREAGEFSVLRAIRQITQNGRLDGLEKEASEAAAQHLGRDLAEAVPSGSRGIAFVIPHDVAQHDFQGGIRARRERALLAGTSTSGGFTVDSPLGPMIELLRNKTVLGRLGITIIDGLVGNLPMPVQTGGATGYWVSETGTITSSSATFGQKTMVPHRCGASIPLSLQFIHQTSLSAEAFARQELMTVLALLKDLAGLEGTGVAGQPLGVKNSGCNATVTYGGAAAWADVVEHETGIATDNADIGSMGFALSVATVGKWKTILKDSVAGAGYLISDAMTANGYPVERTNQITGNISFFGVWSQLMHGIWAGQEVIVDPYGSNAKSGQVEVTIQELCDYLVRQVNAFNISTDTAAA